MRTHIHQYADTYAAVCGHTNSSICGLMYISVCTRIASSRHLHVRIRKYREQHRACVQQHLHCLRRRACPETNGRKKISLLTVSKKKKLRKVARHGVSFLEVFFGSTYPQVDDIARIEKPFYRNFRRVNPNPHLPIYKIYIILYYVYITSVYIYILYVCLNIYYIYLHIGYAVHPNPPFPT
jgi:hypothetical protein